MKKACLAIISIAAFMTSACDTGKGLPEASSGAETDLELLSPIGEDATVMSDTLSQYGDYVAVADHWGEIFEEIDGPRTYLVYRVAMEGGEGEMAAMCVEGAYQYYFTFVKPQMNVVTAPASVSMKIDDRAPEDVKFSTVEGRLGLSPGDGSPAEAKAFMEKLAGGNKVALRVNNLGGRAVINPPAIYSIDGIDAVLQNLELACTV